VAKTRKKPTRRPVIAPAVTSNGLETEVLTLAEAAEYLRISEEEVTDLVRSQNLPGRFTGKEWRFLKAALMGWLMTPAQEAGKLSFLSLAGSWKNDPDIDEIVHEAYQRRRRALPENQE
jgi:excisionase family DNA binding protein